MTSYDGLEQKLAERKLTKSSLAETLGISSRTIAKIAKREPIAPHVMQKIASYLGCGVGDLCRTVSKNVVLQTLREEKEVKLPGGLYHELQVRMTYNSNHIEGSKLSEDQTRMIFETDTVDAGDGIPVDDIIETVNHFRAIDYVIDCAEEPLTEDVVKRLHLLLKQSTKDAALPWFAVGAYKQRANVVGGRETVKPKDVPGKMAELLASYEAKPVKGFDDIVGFHVAFERIHPFQDGNGRVGRLIALKECLRFNIVPFIIEDEKKAFYYRGLTEWDREKGYLTDTCRDGQDTFRRLLAMLDITL